MDTPRADVDRLLAPGSPLVERHLETLARLVAIDSRSFNVNEFPGDLTEPPDMRPILEEASAYLRGIGFDRVWINRTPEGGDWPNPLLLAERHAGADRPTVLMYAHLDKQPYMDDDRWLKWGGVPPTRLHWNEDRTRAYGRGAADDLSGVIAIGLASETLLQMVGGDPTRLPCNLKVIFETEEESGSFTLVDQIRQNLTFFQDCRCVVITDVTNPDTGVPGLTTSLRGVMQTHVSLRKTGPAGLLAEQAALYRLLAALIDEDHHLAVRAVAARDIPVTPEERAGYERVPVTVEQYREAAGLLPGTRLVCPERAADILEYQLRRSYANVRPGHRVTGGVVLGAAGARLTWPLRAGGDPEELLRSLRDHARTRNRFHLKLTVEPVAPPGPGGFPVDLLVQSATKDPHSGVVGGPFPVPELQLARLVESLLDARGAVRVPEIRNLLEPDRPVEVAALHVEHNGQRRLFDKPEARALVEFRLAPGNTPGEAAGELEHFLRERTPEGFELVLEQDKGGAPWMTGIGHPVFAAMLDALRAGYGTEPCLYGCGGSIPFVPKLMALLRDAAPLCLGAYDPSCRLHEPGESLSLIDLLGCARSIVHFLGRAPGIYGGLESRNP